MKNQTVSPPDSQGGPATNGLQVVVWGFVAWLWSPLSVDWFIGDGEVQDPAVRWGFWALSAGLFLWGASALKWRASRRRRIASIALGMSFFVVPIGVECALRASIELGNERVRNPHLYADAFTDDDYWKLKSAWKTPRKSSYHPTLGWKTATTDVNPLGIVREGQYTPRTDNVVLCFGDSYMSGKTDHATRIPALMEKDLDDWPVYNYGMGGYGVGQIYLRFKETHGDYEDPIVVIGIMIRDLDRTILSIREWPKPKFQVVDGRLTVEPPPAQANLAALEAANRPQIRSFFAAMMVHGTRVLRAEGKGANLNYGRERKREVNRAVIEAIVEEARQDNLRLVFVTFPLAQQGGPIGWRDEFLRETFRELKVPWVNGRTIMIRAVNEGRRKRDEFFLPDHHPNALGNQIFATVLLQKIRKLYGVDQPLVAPSKKKKRKRPHKDRSGRPALRHSED